MPSIIEGYNYDIFISYRQKDNKHDGWVTEFVENLKGELESTFKDDISVYFDINPHDGLLETHDVDESLKEKLKCLIFIPIISRTYCDPKSFAWEHEFRAFVEQASEDQFGLKVKLPNGNVASRVLPVQIHELDNEDINLCESLLKGVLRGIEFIYKSVGVNRPLIPKEEDPQDNLNHTHYRDQINKVANAIKEIINALRKHNQLTEETSIETADHAELPHKNRKAKFIAGSIAVLALVIFGILFIPKLFKPVEAPEKSIAVLPFNYLSDEPDKQYLADGMMDAIRLHLSKIEDLQVKDRISVEQYRGTTKTASQICKELGVDYLVEGSFLKLEDKVRLTVDLINPDNRGHIWGEQYENKWDKIFSVQSEVARTIAKELNAAITPEEKLLIDKAPTTDLTAYDLTLQAQKIYYDYYMSWDKSDADLEKIKKLCEAALELDPGFAQAYCWLGMSSLSDDFISGQPLPAFLDTALYFFNKAIELDSTLAEAYDGRGFFYTQKARGQKAIDDLNKSIRLSPSNSDAYFHLGYKYFTSRDYVDALKNLTKADELTKSDAIQLSIYAVRVIIYLSAGDWQKAELCIEDTKQLDPQYAYLMECWMLQVQGKYKELLTEAEKFIALYPESADAYDYKARALLDLGRLPEAEDCIRLRLKYSEPESNTAYWPGIILWKNGKRDEAMKYFNMSKESSPDLPGIYAFLGDKEKAYNALRQLEKLGFQGGVHEFLKYNPLYDNLKNDDEFKEIVKRAGERAAELRKSINELEEQGEL